MKRILCIVILVVMVITLAGCSSGSSVRVSKKFNEDFNIRNGIKFGMTKNEVIELLNKSLESSLDYVLEEYDGPPRVYNHYNLYKKHHTLVAHCNVLNRSGDIYCYFDENYKLIEIGYEFKEQTGDYDYYLKQLKGKYGNPLSSDVADCLYEINPLIARIPIWNLPSSHTIYGNDVYWLVGYKDCDVLIELNTASDHTRIVTYDYPVCMIGYKKTTKEEIEQAVKTVKEREKQQNQNEKNSIEKDL